LQDFILLQAARGLTTSRPPVWIMRQAGRILPEYRAVRAKFNGFKEFVKNPEACCEVTLQPINILGVDAAIIFSDILVVAEAMGLDYEMIESKGPLFYKTIQNTNDLDTIKIVDANSLHYVIEAIKLTKVKLLNTAPLIGFAGAPFTLFAYMTEGSSSKTFSKAKNLMFTRPDVAHELLYRITATTINYLEAQILAGVDMIQLFDSWAGILSPGNYQEFGLGYCAKIITTLKQKFPHIPITLFAKGANHSITDIAFTGCDVIGLDWTISIPYARLHSAGKALQGNLDPCILYGNKAFIQKNTIQLIEAMKGHPFIANLGHGVYPDTHVDHIKYFIECIMKNV